MPKWTSITGSQLFIVDNSDEDWKVMCYLHDRRQIPRSNKRPIGYRPLAAAPFPALVNAALVPIGRLPGGRIVVFTEGE